MKIAAPLIPLAAFAALVSAGCTTDSSERLVETATTPVTAPINAAVNNAMPLPQDTQYTYWKRVPGTNLVEAHISDRPLSLAEQEALGIIAPKPSSETK